MSSPCPSVTGVTKPAGRHEREAKVTWDRGRARTFWSRPSTSVLFANKIRQVKYFAHDGQGVDGPVAGGALGCVLAKIVGVGDRADRGEGLRENHGRRNR